MNKIPKCRSKYFIPQVNNIKVTQKETIKEHLVPKITQKNLKFSANRQFGKDITNSVKDNIHSILYNNHNTKVISIVDKKQNSKVYIKKHSSASQVAQKNQKTKIGVGEKKLREYKSGSLINNKNDITYSEYYYNNNNNNNSKNINVPQSHQGGSKLHSSISFGINNKRPISSVNNCISVRLSNPKNNSKVYTILNNKSINIYSSNNNYTGILNNNYNNNKIQHTYSNLDLM
jgi:hypothetical protein